MNIRKPADYSVLFSELDKLIAAQLPQMELYREIGRVVSSRAEKGAAVAASDVRRRAGVAGSGNASELDTECGHHGGRIDHGREVLVHSEGRRKRLIQKGAAADD